MGRSSGAIKFMFPRLHSHSSAMQYFGLKSNASYKEYRVPYILESISRGEDILTHVHGSKASKTHDPYF